LKVVTGEVSRRAASAPKARSGRSWSRVADDSDMH
jgi:hypothetical protein